MLLLRRCCCSSCCCLLQLQHIRFCLQRNATCALDVRRSSIVFCSAVRQQQLQKSSTPLDLAPLHSSGEPMPAAETHNTPSSCSFSSCSSSCCCYCCSRTQVSLSCTDSAAKHSLTPDGVQTAAATVTATAATAAATAATAAPVPSELLWGVAQA